MVLATHLRIRPFDAALMIALAQDRARRGEGFDPGDSIALPSRPQQARVGDRTALTDVRGSAGAWPSPSIRADDESATGALESINAARLLTVAVALGMCGAFAIVSWIVR